MLFFLRYILTVYKLAIYNFCVIATLRTIYKTLKSLICRNTWHNWLNYNGINHFITMYCKIELEFLYLLANVL
jgi:hypothetical protein